MFVNRRIPQNTQKYTLKSNNGAFGMINLSWPDNDQLRHEISQIDGCNAGFILDDVVEIYFPAWAFITVKQKL